MCLWYVVQYMPAGFLSLSSSTCFISRNQHLNFGSTIDRDSFTRHLRAVRDRLMQTSCGRLIDFMDEV